MNKRPHLILGGGGHAASLAEILIKQGVHIVGVVSPQISAGKALFDGVPHYVSDDDILKFSPENTLLVNGIGSMPYQSLRESIYNRFRKMGYKFATVIADSATVSDYSVLHSGVQVMNKCVINLGCTIGENTIINTSSSIDHDCNLGSHCHVAPGSVLSGQVLVQDNVHIATGVRIVNNITIGERAIISVGANVTKSVPAKSIVYGSRAIVKGLEIDDN